MKLLVIGGSYLGIKVAVSFSNFGHNVTLATRTSLAFDKPVFTVLNYSKYADLITFDFSKFDFVIYATGKVDHSYFSVCESEFFTEHFFNVARLVDSGRLNHIRGFVYLGSSDEYGVSRCEVPFTETSLPSPSTSYALAKQLTTQYLMQKFRACNFPCLILRPFLIYGPDQPSNRLIGGVINALRCREPFKIHNTQHYRDFLYIDDFLSFLQLLLGDFENVKGNVINVCSGQATSLVDLGHMINDLSDSECVSFLLPASHILIVSCMGPMQKLIGLRDGDPKVSLIEGLNECLQP